MLGLKLIHINKRAPGTVFLLAHWCPRFGLLCIDGWMQNKCNSIADALEARVFCIKPSICGTSIWRVGFTKPIFHVGYIYIFSIIKYRSHIIYQVDINQMAPQLIYGGVGQTWTGFNWSDLFSEKHKCLQRTEFYKPIPLANTFLGRPKYFCSAGKLFCCSKNKYLHNMHRETSTTSKCSLKWLYQTCYNNIKDG